MIKVLTIEISTDWDKLVRSFADYDTYWLSGYVKAFQLHGDGVPLLFYYESKNSDVRGINVVMKRDIADAEQFYGKLEHGKFFDFSTPYGYGGWLIENLQNESTDCLFEEYERYCQKENIVSEFVRFHPVIKNHLVVGSHYETVQLGEVVAIDLASPETIWENFSSKNRNVIRKAINNGIKIYNGRYPDIYEVFRNIYNKTMDKDNAKDYYYFKPEFYNSLLNDLAEDAQVFYAQMPDGTVIAASIMLAANKMMNYHLSGSLREHSSLAATNLLLYKAALWGCANGYKTLYLGGGVGSGEDSLFKFKRAFYKGELNRFWIGKKVFSDEIYQKLIEIRKGDSPMTKNTAFFPTYRATAISAGGGINLTVILIVSVTICISLPALVYKEVR